MTLEERIAKATMALGRSLWNDDFSSDRMREDAKAALAAGFPEVFGETPSHWLAPMEPDEGMKREVQDWAYRLEHYERTFEASSAGDIAEWMFNIMRDHVLNRDKKE